MTRIYLVVLSVLAVASLPVAARAQQNTREIYVNPRTGEEILGPYYANRYLEELRQLRREEEEEGEKVWEDLRESEVVYAKDACGVGCEDHEGIQVRGIPGTSLAAVIYKAHIDDDDVLTLQLRFHNDGLVPERLVIDPSTAPGSFYVEVGDEKLTILEDEDGELQAKEPLDEVVEPGDIFSWWARFPAPPSGTASFDLEIFPFDAFRNVPLHVD